MPKKVLGLFCVLTIGQFFDAPWHAGCCEEAFTGAKPSRQLQKKLPGTLTHTELAWQREILNAHSSTSTNGKQKNKTKTRKGQPWNASFEHYRADQRQGHGKTPKKFKIRSMHRKQGACEGGEGPGAKLLCPSVFQPRPSPAPFSVLLNFEKLGGHGPSAPPVHTPLTGNYSHFKRKMFLIEKPHENHRKVG